MYKKQILMVIAGFIGLSFTGCDKSKPDRDYMPDMFFSTAFKAQSEDMNSADGSANRMPPDGTIPRNFNPYHLDAAEQEKAGQEFKNPFPRTQANLERGQKVFNTYCIVCHGEKGDGAGSIVPPYPRPPSLFSDKVKGWPDGRIFHIISKGQNTMPNYASQIVTADRWLVVHYIRALQRAAGPTAEDLKEYGGMKK